MGPLIGFFHCMNFLNHASIKHWLFQAQFAECFLAWWKIKLQLLVILKWPQIVCNGMFMFMFFKGIGMFRKFLIKMIITYCHIAMGHIRITITSLWPCYTRCNISGSTLNQVMSCHLFGTKPWVTWTNADISFIEPLGTKYNLKYAYIWKCLLQCGVHFVFVLTYCGLMTPYGDVELGQHWLR